MDLLVARTGTRRFVNDGVQGRQRDGHVAAYDDRVRAVAGACVFSSKGYIFAALRSTGGSMSLDCRRLIFERGDSAPFPSWRPSIRSFPLERPRSSPSRLPGRRAPSSH